MQFNHSPYSGTGVTKHELRAWGLKIMSQKQTRDQLLPNTCIRFWSNELMILIEKSPGQVRMKGKWLHSLELILNSSVSKRIQKMNPPRVQALSLSLYKGDGEREFCLRNAITPRQPLTGPSHQITESLTRAVVEVVPSPGICAGLGVFHCSIWSAYLCCRESFSIPASQSRNLSNARKSTQPGRGRAGTQAQVEGS